MALFSNATDIIRQRIARVLDDLILATVSSGSTTTAVLATTDPPLYRNKADDYFNDHEYEVYTYEGINIGESAVAKDWTLTSPAHTLTVDRTLSTFTTASKLELHRIFTSGEYLNAINLAIEAAAGKYLVDIKDETTVVLVEGETNDENIIYTYEYTLPTDLLYIHRVITEGSKGGKKLTGTVSGAFTLGEKVTGQTSTATGILSYGPSGSTYILIREVDGTFTVGETATGAGGETCSSITVVADETVGNGKFESRNIVDTRDWSIIKAYSPKIKFNEGYYKVVGDLRIRLEGQGSQAKVSADTDNIFLPPDWIVWKAITFLPYSKIESANLSNVFNSAEAKSARPISTEIHPSSKSVIE